MISKETSSVARMKEQSGIVLLRIINIYQEQPEA